jgi:hypothetical protein
MGGLVDSITGRGAAEAAGQASAGYTDAGRRSLDMYKKMWEQQQGYLNPYHQMGVDAVNQMQSGNWQQDPGYQFRLDQGMNALNKSAAAKGGTTSGNALAAATKYGQDMGSQEYQNAFNRQMQKVGIGYGAGNQLGNWAGQYGDRYGNTEMDLASNWGNSKIAQQNARDQGWGNIARLGGQVLGGF